MCHDLLLLNAQPPTIRERFPTQQIFEKDSQRTLEYIYIYIYIYNIHNCVNYLLLKTQRKQNFIPSRV